mgnify:CR=1 FL=1
MSEPVVGVFHSGDKDHLWTVAPDASLGELEQVKAERDRLAAEVVSLTGALREANALVAELIKANRREVENNTRLAESILDHDCPSFSMCPKHIGNRELEECPYCTIERLEARWKPTAAIKARMIGAFELPHNERWPVVRHVPWALIKQIVATWCQHATALEREEAK